ncbi:hypothetical protein C8R44DRAFT_745616 [Mycena epipterygia]|nr:hypothetical protein C8R44DRAFT_745616 [Mycena epipterygia]
MTRDASKIRRGTNAFRLGVIRGRFCPVRPWLVGRPRLTNEQAKHGSSAFMQKRPASHPRSSPQTTDTYPFGTRNGVDLEEVKRLEQRRKEILPLLELYRVALAPHKVLPIDILREIFICAAQSTWPKADLNYIISARRQATGHTTHSLPDLEDLDSGKTTRLLAVLGIWLFRSGQYPLTMDIAGETGDPRAIALLSQHSHRFCSLSIHPASPFVVSSAGSVDLMEKLELRGMYKLLPSLPVFAGIN